MCPAPVSLAVVATLATCAHAAALGGGSKDTAQLVRDTRSVGKSTLYEVDARGLPSPGAAEQKAEQAALQTEKMAEGMGKSIVDGPAKLEDMGGAIVGQPKIAETGMPESPEAQKEAGKFAEDINLINNLEDKAEASIFHKMTDGKNQQACDENAFLTWTGSVCVLHGWVLLVINCGLGAIWGGVWWIVCKGKGRSQRSWDEHQLAATPYKADKDKCCSGVCGCMPCGCGSNLKPLACMEAWCCTYFMWGETMIRSGTLPTVVVGAVGFFVFVMTPFVHSLQLIFCMFRFVGRFKLRQKMESSEEQQAHEGEETSDALMDAVCAGCCGPCAVAQEAEYLELRANEGQPAPDGADLRHLLEHFTEKDEKQGEWAGQQSW